MASVVSEATPRLNDTVRRRFKTRTEEPEGGPVRLPHTREAWVYKRLSTHEQRKHSIWSLKQQDELEEMACREGYVAPLIGEQIASLKAATEYPGFYANGQIHVEERDIGISGTKNHKFRPGLAALIEAISAGRVEAVYVVHISRLYRDQTLIDAMTFADLCKRHNVVIVTPQLIFDLNQDLYFDIYKMEIENAVRELKVMKLRLTGNKLLKARHGYYDGRGIEWGYTLDLDKESPTYQKLVPYEPHAAVVREVFRLALYYRTARKVRQHMLEHDFYFPPFAPEVMETIKGRHSLKSCRLRGDGSWLPSKQAVLSILTNPVYVGWWLVQGEVISKTNHPVIVDEETFWAVQEIWNPIDYRTGKPNAAYSFNAGRDTGRRALLTGLLYCGEHPEDGEWSQHYLCANFGQVNKDGSRQNWYICAVDYQEDHRQNACFHTRQEVIDEAIVAHVLQRVSLDGVTREVVEHLEQESEQERAEARRHKSLRDQLLREIEGLKKKLPWAETKSDYGILMAEIHQRERQIEQLMRPKWSADGLLTVAQVVEVEAFLRTLSRAWPRVKPETKRWFLEVLLDRVTIYHDRSQMVYLHLRWRTGLVDVLRVYRVHPPRPEGWRWDTWEDEAIRAHYPTCQHVSEVLSLVKPFRNWWGAKQRASQLGVHRALKQPPEGVAEHSDFGYKKKNPERRSYEYLGSYTEAERRAWLGEGRRPPFFPGEGVSNMGTDASSQCAASPSTWPRPISRRRVQPTTSPSPWGS